MPFSSTATPAGFSAEQRSAAARSTLKNEINQQYYGPHVYVRDILSGRVAAPKAAARLYELLDGGR